MIGKRMNDGGGLRTPVRAGLLGAALCGMAFGGGSAAHAVLVAEENFDYGPTSGPLIGKGAGGGDGFTRAWSNTIGSEGFEGARTTYQSTGLTFSNLTVSGGSAQQLQAPENGGFAVTEVNRRFGPAGGSATNLTGTLFGAFLFRLDDRNSAGTVSSFLIGGEFDNDNQASVALQADEFGANKGATRFEGAGTTQDGPDQNVDQTYIYLFQLGLDPASQTAKTWALSEAQFDNFKNGNLTEAMLDAASTGTDADDVTGRSSASRTGALEQTNHLQLFAFNGDNPQTTFLDEFRISNESLAEAAPFAVVPEPASATLAALGLATLAMRRRRPSR